MGQVDVIVFAGWEEHSRRGFLKWFWCALDGSVMLGSAEAWLKGRCVVAQLVWDWGVLLAQRGSLFLAVALREHGPCCWIVTV